MKPSSKPTILHIAPTPFFSNRGCHIRIRNAVLASRPHGYRSVICTYHHGTSPEDLSIRRIARIPGYHQTTAGYSPFKFIADIFLFALVLRAVKTERPDLIHAHLHEGALLGWTVRYLLSMRNLPLIMDMQGSLSGELAAYGTFAHRPWVLNLFKNMERLICRMPDLFVCSSIQSVDILQNDFGVPDPKAVLLADAVPSFFFGTPSSKENKKRLGIPENTSVVIYTGSLLEGKGLRHLFAAMDRLLLDNSCNVFFIVVGYPKDQVNDRILKKGYADRCLLTGEVPYEQLPEFLSMADVALEPKSVHAAEASGKMMHYMAAGLPVVCFDSPFHRKLLGKGGYFSAPNDDIDFVNNIKAALDNPDTAQKKGEWGKTYAQTHFSLEACGRKLCRVYEQLLR